MTTSMTDRIDTRDMIVVHTALRREFRLAPGLVRGTSAGDLCRVSIIAGHLDLMNGFLHLHHTGEDRLLWPRLLDRAPQEIAAVVMLMQTQHERIHDLITSAQGLLQHWKNRAGCCASSHAPHRLISASSARRGGDLGGFPVGGGAPGRLGHRRSAAGVAPGNLGPGGAQITDDLRIRDHRAHHHRYHMDRPYVRPLTNSGPPRAATTNSPDRAHYNHKSGQAESRTGNCQSDRRQCSPQVAAQRHAMAHQHCGASGRGGRHQQGQQRIRHRHLVHDQRRHCKTPQRDGAAGHHRDHHTRRPARAIPAHHLLPDEATRHLSAPGRDGPVR